MNYAIVEASGRQFWVEPGRFYDFNSLNLNPGDKIALTRVLLVNENGNIRREYGSRGRLSTTVWCRVRPRAVPLPVLRCCPAALSGSPGPDPARLRASTTSIYTIATIDDVHSTTRRLTHSG